ncbi:hypothetical protein [Neomicrococcus aestuarii]|uniref:Uncharacterized protein n=1 Tax=Neomicrococcus aestuarii TaxID=556325 RepID=A0A1L2ZQU5_9MICC|nr:hypothetical protein [Neomicrococcus aestuarii]APF41570.1 hypothetical protein BHE16_11875 [Neomicrococcus aestuarii]
MTDHKTNGISRRSIAKGAAWAAPVIAVAATAPFAAASHHVPPPPVSVPGNSCKTSGNSGTIKKGFYGQFKITNNTGADLVYTITSFASSSMILSDVQVMPLSSTDWSIATSTFTVPDGGTTTFWIRAVGDDSGNTSFTMTYTVVGYGDTYDEQLNYIDMPVCCDPAPLCPPGAYAEGVTPTTSSAPVEAKTSATPTTEAAPSSATEQAAPTSEAAAPVTETQTAKATESAVATEAPASSSN